MAIYEKLYPRGNFLDIRDNASTQADYNVRATEDLVRNLPGGLLKDILSPAAAAALSVPYDTIQGISRADSYTPSGIMKAISAENPLSSAYERFIGASAPLAERISNMSLAEKISDMFSMGKAEASDLGEIANLQSILNPKTPESVKTKNIIKTNNLFNSTPELDYNLDPEVNMGATGTVPTLEQSILSQPELALYKDIAEEGDDLEDSAVTVDELGNLKQSKGIMEILRGLPTPTNLLLNMLPKEDPRATNVRNFYGDRYGLTSSNSLASGIMKGYNPVYGNDFLNKISGGIIPEGGFGLANAARKRIEKIANRKRAQTDASRAKIAELQRFAEADTANRARFDNQNVYRDAGDRGTLGPGGGFSTSGREGAFSSKSGRGRKDF